MKIVSGKIYALRIPFVEAFAHSTKNRKFSDSFIVRLVAEDGTIGFGEGVARPYVTGETVETSVDFIKKQIFPNITENDFQEIQPSENSIHSIAALSANFPDIKFADGVIYHAAQAAVEIALLDCLLKSQNISLGKILPPKRAHVVYSGVISAGTLETAVQHARRFKLFGIKQLKIKIGFSDDELLVAKIRETVGDEVSLRLDANGASDVKSAVRLACNLEKFKIDSIEQPILRGSVKDLAEVRAASPIFVMADESLISVDDAKELIEFSACDFFNLRLSKCGGFANALAIARLANEAKIRLQIGCQVGETAILSAAGRHLAAHLAEAEFVEGSYGNLLLAEDVGENSINFGNGGRAPLLRGAGIGVKVREQILEKYADSIINLGKESAGYA